MLSWLLPALLSEATLCVTVDRCFAWKLAWPDWSKYTNKRTKKDDNLLGSYAISNYQSTEKFKILVNNYFKSNMDDKLAVFLIKHDCLHLLRRPKGQRLFMFKTKKKHIISFFDIF